MQLLAPTRIGRYEIRGELGRGSMGAVFAAYDPNLDRLVALKVLAPQLSAPNEQGADLLERFRLEAKAAARLSHPSIVAIHDAGVDEATGCSYIAMELVAGRSLEAILLRHRHLPPIQVVALGIQLARALEAAHRSGLVHRDVKPGNVLVAQDGTAKLSDFGIAKLGLQSLTIPGQVLGSPFYMSPEQVQGVPADGRSDLFALGAVLYQALAGVPPFSGDNLAAIVFKVVNVEPRPISERAPEVPPALEEIVLRCLAKNPTERFASAAALAAALERLVPEMRENAGDGVAGLAAMVEVGALGAATLPVNAVDTSATTIVAGSHSAPSSRSSRRRTTLMLLLAGSLLGASVLAWRLGSRRPATVAPETSTSTPLPILSAAEQMTPEPETELPLADPGPSPAPVQLPAELLVWPESPDPGPTDSQPIAPTPTPTPTPAPEPVLDRSATLELIFRSRLKTAFLAVWVDRQLAWSGPVYGHGNVFRRPFGKETRQQIRLPPGERTIEVRIEGRSMETVASRVVVGRFRPDQQRQLRATLNPYSDTLELDWLDGAKGTR